MPETDLIDGFGPVPAVRPARLAELGDVVRAATAVGNALYPVGGRTMLNLGMPPRKQGLVVDLRALDGVIDYPARDMTITVEAGITVARLQEILAAENQRLPIDVPQADQATLGGILACNVSGPRRYGFGTLRDYVIGISAVNDEGQEFKAGGRVVKNVAGYDLCKLLVGSLGTLGIITQVTLKLRPRAEEQALVVLACDASTLEGLLDRLHASRTRPVCLDMLNRGAAEKVLLEAGLPGPEGDWTLVIGFEGNYEAVRWQVQQLVKEVGGAGSLEALVGFTATPLWQALTEWNAWPGSEVTFKANILSSAVARFCRSVESLAPTFLCAHAGNGIVVGHFTGELTKQAVAAKLGDWRELAGKSQGSVMVPRCPPAWKDVVSVWGPAREDVWLMRAVKEKLDPRRVFNRGRFVDGI